MRVDRFFASAQVRDEVDEGRVRRLVDDIAGGRVEPDLAGTPAAEGWWCVRRVDIDIPVDSGPLLDVWLGSVRAALLADLAGRRLTWPGQGPAADDQDLVGYRHPVAALADLVASLAVGRPTRAWAWRSLGLLTAHDPDAEHDPPAAALAALGRHPERSLPALAGAATAVGGVALHRLLGNAGLRSLATMVLRGAGADPGPWLAAVGTVAPPAPPIAGLERRSALARAWAATALPLLDGGGRAALVSLVVAETEPALLRSRPLPGLREALAAGLSSNASPRSGLGVRTDPASLEPLRARPEADATGRLADPDPHVVLAGERTSTSEPETALDPAGPAPGSEELAGVTTAWGGLVHLLATAEAAQVPDAVIADPALAGLVPSGSLHHLLVVLAAATDEHGRPDPGDDPVVAALSGRRVDEEPPGEPTAAERTALEGHADRWRHVTADRLGAKDPGEAMVRLLPRQGRVVAWPGWVEIHLLLTDVDPDVRRAGLDLDQGFVPWLGRVVVIRYE
jgi:hypothetical protein